MEYTNQDRNKEMRQPTREVVLHFIRHGESKYTGSGDHEGCLTEIGQEQSRRAARKLFAELNPGSVLAFYTSPRLRTRQTAEIIENELQVLNKGSNKQILFHNLKPNTVKRVGLDDNITEASLDLTFAGLNPIATWLQNPNDMTMEMETNFLSFLKKFSGLANRISPTGPDIHLVTVTHTGPSEVFVAKLLKVNSLSTLTNGEEFKIELPVSDNRPTLTYKGLTNEISF